MARSARERDHRLPDAAPAAASPEPPPGPAPGEGGQNRVSELRVSGHLMTLDTGVFCVFQAPGSPPTDAASGLPGVRISLPPGPSGRPEAVSISTFRQDGWLDGAALVRVAQGPAQVLVTIYQSPRQGAEGAPRLQVTRLSGEGAAVAAPPPSAPGPAAAPATAATAEDSEIVAHVQRTGDVGSHIGDWVGTRGSRAWIEGFAIVPREGLSAEDIEYQGYRPGWKAATSAGAAAWPCRCLALRSG
jgi:hypothetical protein